MGDPVGDMGEAIAVDIDDPPAGVPQPGIEPENAHRLRPLSAHAGGEGAQEVGRVRSVIVRRRAAP